MQVQVIPLRESNVKQWKQDMQDAFLRGAVEGLGMPVLEILPESHIDRSLADQGAVAYEAVVDGELVGGAVVKSDRETHHNQLDFLYVKYGMQGRGLGQAIWKALEAMTPDTLLWETCTPYFDKRNIHFYINCCGFHAVEFFNAHHPDSNESFGAETFPAETDFDGMFRFEKRMFPCEDFCQHTKDGR